MLIIIGIILVLACTALSFVWESGFDFNRLSLLFHIAELVAIFGITFGAVLISTPAHVLKETLAKIIAVMTGKTINKAHYFELIGALYELFQTGRKSGLLALEEHVSAPAQSAIFKKYPTLLAAPDRLAFIVDCLKPLVDGRIKPDQLEGVIDMDINTKTREVDHCAHVLNFAGDSLPGIGIVAAVMGIINTMAIIDQGTEAVASHMAAALSGTMLGVFAAYGFANPLASSIRSLNEGYIQYLRCTKIAVVAFAKGMAPLTAAELARRSLDHSVQPSAEALETALRGGTAAK
ncbi:MAG: motility-associated protein [Opitutaceae bacterium]|jgi:chemotaxis protein MotA